MARETKARALMAGMYNVGISALAAAEGLHIRPRGTLDRNRKSVACWDVYYADGKGTYIKVYLNRVGGLWAGRVPGLKRTGGRTHFSDLAELRELFGRFSEAKKRKGGSS